MSAMDLSTNTIDILNSSRFLRVLDLSKCNLKDDLLASIHETIKNNPILSVLDVSQNPLLTEKHIVTIIQQSTLKHLNLAVCLLGRAGWTKVAEALLTNVHLVTCMAGDPDAEDDTIAFLQVLTRYEPLGPLEHLFLRGDSQKLAASACHLERSLTGRVGLVSFVKNVWAFYMMSGMYWSCLDKDTTRLTLFFLKANATKLIKDHTYSRKSFKDKKWITAGLKISIKHKNRLYKKFLTKPNQINEGAYKRYKNKLLATIELAKKTYYTEKLASDKAKLHDVWKVYSELLGRTKSCHSSKVSKLIYNGQVNNTNKTIANAFNEYFCTIGTNLAGQHYSPINYQQYLTKPQNVHTMFTAPVSAPVSTVEVNELVLKLSPHKAAGIDGLNAKTVKNALPTILDPTTHVYNLSLSQGCVPEQLKISKVIPILKKNETFLPGNYRPISLLSIFDKILERLMYTRLHSFLSKHRILHEIRSINSALEVATQQRSRSLKLLIISERSWINQITS
ncbi:hypothetical protein CAPTEDRAFT_213070 [Capitella teleta]|uniref:Reverse transcriptase domain-containing protein n=1 Tax=Capitella teleta TaxID=283909 RepID=R7T9Q3_CAPTE|nr:hypothetical protein CAPTEDRAFT_213070 [Capitella teleta]|eukprot:ELT87714.1 hypothetical protein CAPTEDRAFT_213070 [Capitella teleta]